MLYITTSPCFAYRHRVFYLQGMVIYEFKREKRKVRNDYDPNKHITHSGASFTQTLKKIETWVTVAVDYDFGRTINNISSKRSVGDALQITDLSENASIISDFYVVIQGLSANQIIQVDNVKLVKKEK